MWDDAQRDWVNGLVESLSEDNPDWDFEYRKTK